MIPQIILPPVNFLEAHLPGVVEGTEEVVRRPNICILNFNNYISTEVWEPDSFMTVLMQLVPLRKDDMRKWDERNASQVIGIQATTTTCNTVTALREIRPCIIYPGLILNVSRSNQNVQSVKNVFHLR